MSAPHYEDIEVKIDVATRDRIAELGAMCDLTPDQMASAIIVLETYRVIAAFKDKGGAA